MKAALLTALMALSLTATAKPCTDEDAGYTPDYASPTGFLWENRDDRGCHLICPPD